MKGAAQMNGSVEHIFVSAKKHASIASAQLRSRLNPYELGSAVHSATGSRVSWYIACIARSRIVGMPRGLFLPFFFGM